MSEALNKRLSAKPDPRTTDRHGRRIASRRAGDIRGSIYPGRPVCGSRSAYPRNDRHAARAPAFADESLPCLAGCPVLPEPERAIFVARSIVVEPPIAVQLWFSLEPARLFRQPKQVL